MKYRLEQQDDSATDERVVDANDLLDTAMYLIWTKPGYTPISVSGAELKEGYSGNYKFKDNMPIMRVN